MSKDIDCSVMLGFLLPESWSIADDDDDSARKEIGIPSLYCGPVQNNCTTDDDLYESETNAIGIVIADGCDFECIQAAHTELVCRLGKINKFCGTDFAFTDIKLVVSVHAYY